jgi:hypothetical protein
MFLFSSVLCLPTLSYMLAMCKLDSSGEFVDLGILLASQVHCKDHLLDSAICLLDSCTSMVSHVLIMTASPFFSDCLFGQLQAKNQHENCMYLAVNNMRVSFQQNDYARSVEFWRCRQECFYLQFFTDPSSIIYKRRRNNKNENEMTCFGTLN